MMVMSAMFDFDFAVSYAGEESGLANDLYLMLRAKGAKVFFARHAQSYLLGKTLGSGVEYWFGPATRFVIPIFSSHYGSKQWPMREFSIAKEEELRRKCEVILPIRIDETPITGLEDDRVYIDLRKVGINDVADILMKKLHDNQNNKSANFPTMWFATFGVVIEDLFEKDELPAEAPTEYPQLCDWLTKDLIRRMSESETISEVTFLEDSRSGESLSVRVKFKWDPEKSPLDFGIMGLWEVLEVEELERLGNGA